MKIRLDFVTNSSSSSFTCVALYSEELYNFLQKLISEKKYVKQPSWGYSQPEYELHLDWIWEELKFDKICYKVQTTEQYGDTDKKSIYEHISRFFEGLTTNEEETLRELIYAVYKDKEYQTKKYKDQTDGFVGFDFRNKYTKADEKGSKNDEMIQTLIGTLGKMSVDPEDIDPLMKIISMNFHHIDGHGIYDPDSDRYKHLDKSFLDSVVLGWVDSDNTPEYNEYLLAEEKKKRWAEHLRTLYEDAVDDTGAITVGNISSRVDYAVVYDSIDSAVDRYELERLLAEATNKYRFSLGFNHAPEEKVELFKKTCYIRYLQSTLAFLEEANNNKGDDKPPISIIWESHLHDYLMKHTSLGNVTPEPAIGPNGTERLKIPEQHKKAMGYVIAEMVGRWPSRVINPKTKTYEKLVKSIEACNKDIGYVSTDAFFDAYGFSIKQDSERVSVNTYDKFEYEKTKKTNEITIVRYTGADSRVIIPASIDGSPVTTIGKDAFCRNKSIEEVHVPDSVDTMRGGAFSFCGNLKKIHLSNRISKIVSETFDGCNKLEEINIPDMISEIPPGLFKDCPLKTLHIGKNMSEVSRNDFYKGEIVTENAINVIAKTSAMGSITVDPQNRFLKSIDSMILSRDGKILMAMLGEDSYCEIPYGVEIISDSAFERQGFLKAVSLPESLRIIGNKAFESSGLEKVSFPSSLRIIGSRAFQLCREMTEVDFLEGVEIICNYAFLGTNIRSVSFPDSLAKMGTQAFDYWKLEDVEPEKWKDEMQKWRYETTGTSETIDTQEIISELRKAVIKEAVDEQFENKIGLGILISMMAYLQSDKVEELSLGERLRLERIVISKEMEAILRTDLKVVLSNCTEKSIYRFRSLVWYLKTEADKKILDDYSSKIRAAFPGDEGIAMLLENVIDQIGKEV